MFGSVISHLQGKVRQADQSRQQESPQAYSYKKTRGVIMIAWILHHKIAVVLLAVFAIFLLRRLLRPPTWKDGEGDNDALVNIDSFKQFHH
jgi:hypothetical protein